MTPEERAIAYLVVLVGTFVAGGYIVWRSRQDAEDDAEMHRVAQAIARDQVDATNRLADVLEEERRGTEKGAITYRYDGSVILDPRAMRVGRPYYYELDGLPFWAIRKSDDSLDIYGVPWWRSLATWLRRKMPW